MTAPWKGLDTSCPPVFLGYDQTERMLNALLPRAWRWRPEAVVGIARGGVVPATMAATALALPLAFLDYDRAARCARWIGAPPSRRRILLVEDGCSTGRTLAGARAALLAQGRECLTMAVVHDPERALHVPDLSHPMRELWRFPWERGEATPSARVARGSGASDLAAEAPFVGVDLAVAIRPCGFTDPLAALPLFAPDRAVIVSALAEHERPYAKGWLALQGYGGLPLDWPGAEGSGDAVAAARHKAAAATRWGCTHFIEGHPAQAILIAAAAPHLVVTWWSAAENAGYLVGVAAHR